jgi:Putative adhesin
MSTPQSRARNNRWIPVCALAALIVPWTLVQAGKAIEERRAADPQGEVEIVNISGTVEVAGWDRSEVLVSGSVGDNVERVDVTSAGNRTSIHVVSRSGHAWKSDDEAHLLVRVPAKSTVTASLVSADFKVTGVQGDLKLQAVSGNLSGDGGGNVRASSVSGDVHLTARAAKSVELKTISGDIEFTGGGGEVDITTVSGSAKLDLGEVTRGRFKTVSGDTTAALALTPDGQLESESVSGDVSFKFATEPAAEFDVQSFSGDIRNCFGPKAVESKYGPGSRLSFKNGEGRGHVRINTKSGEVHLCVEGKKGSHGSALSLAQVKSPLVVPYVF